MSPRTRPHLRPSRSPGLITLTVEGMARTQEGVQDAEVGGTVAGTMGMADGGGVDVMEAGEGGVDMVAGDVDTSRWSV